jgi:hypothetical protein
MKNPEKLMNVDHDVQTVTVTMKDGTVHTYEIAENKHLMLGIITVTDYNEEGYNAESTLLTEANGMVVRRYIEDLQEAIGVKSIPSFEDLLGSILEDIATKHDEKDSE